MRGIKIIHIPTTLLSMIDSSIGGKTGVNLKYGKRIVLNFGHTFGHAIELSSKYNISHGEAIAIGMVAAVNLSIYLGIWKESASEQIIPKCLKRFNLPVKIDGYSCEDIFQNMLIDKKRKGDSLLLILPVSIGNVVVVENIPMEIVLKAINSIII